MKLKIKIITVVMSVICILAAFSFGVSANVPQATPDDTADLSVNDNTESKTSLSPKGNVTSIDDVHQITDTSDKNTIEDKQFITVESKNGNVFYIIIDRSGDTDNVYFLNAVDESDLMALMEEEQKAELTAVCTCADKCEIGAVDENCAVCSKDITKCIGKETVPEEEKDKETKEEQKKSGNPLAFLIILLILGGGGAFYWFKIKNKKSSTKGTSDPSDYEDDEEEETEYETDTEGENVDEDETEPDDQEDEGEDE